VTLAYETYGRLNARKDNAILILHALSGDAHAAGYHRGAEKPGWWDDMIGPGRAFDTDKYFVICSNVLGGCRGSTGPSSINPATNRHYAFEFPVITIKDMVNAQRHLIDHLGIEKLLSVVGGSMGGMQALQWAATYPNRVSSVIPIATAMKHSPQQIAFNAVGRQAIISDPDWRGGNYYGGPLPAKGLSVARMIGHITYMSDVSMGEKFGRRFRNGNTPSKFGVDFEVEGYLHYHGDNFVKRFDANSYLYITRALDYFDLSNGRSLYEVFRDIKAKFLIIAFKSDWLYPAYQSSEILKICKLSGVEATYCEINSTYGHDAFLLEVQEETHLIRHFLKRVYNGYTIADDRAE
ncbi:MAG TPA: homoserine O-acetyltransferase, partial [Candidatus Methanoperedenaceae archaeon]|nr:homoserine O-acetyltransferase [Candidatus Methanoperedenaceae archaeon]